MNLESPKVTKVLTWLLISCSVAGLILTFLKKFSFIDFGAPISLVLGIYLLKLKEWARKGIIIYTSISIVLRVAFAIFFISQSSSLHYVFQNTLTPDFFFGVIFPLLVLYHFTRPKVKEQFR